MLLVTSSCDSTHTLTHTRTHTDIRTPVLIFLLLNQHQKQKRNHEKLGCVFAVWTPCTSRGGRRKQTCCRCCRCSSRPAFFFSFFSFSVILHPPKYADYIIRSRQPALYLSLTLFPQLCECCHIFTSKTEEETIFLFFFCLFFLKLCLEHLQSKI